MKRGMLDGAVPALNTSVAVHGRRTFVSLSSLASGTIAVESLRGGCWATEATLSAAGVYEIKPCIAWRFVAASGKPTYSAGYIAVDD